MFVVVVVGVGWILAIKDETEEKDVYWRAGILGAGPGLGTERLEEGRMENPEVPGD